MSGGLFDYVQNQMPTEATESLSEPRSRTPLEITQAEQQQALERSREVYKAYQDNIMRAGTLRSEIIKGLQQGENMAILFLKAMEIIACMTGEDTSYQLAKDTVTAVYCDALRQPEALEVARTGVQERLAHLENALQYANSTEKERILQAIEAHHKKLEQLSE